MPFRFLNGWFSSWPSGVIHLHLWWSIQRFSLIKSSSGFQVSSQDTFLLSISILLDVSRGIGWSLLQWLNDNCSAQYCCTYLKLFFNNFYKEFFTISIKQEGNTFVLKCRWPSTTSSSTSKSSSLAAIGALTASESGFLSTDQDRQ